MRDQWQRSDRKSKSRHKDKNRGSTIRDDYELIEYGGPDRRGGRKRQLEEITELELEEMLDMADREELAQE